MRPFWNYYGGKFRHAPRYPKPMHGTIVVCESSNAKWLPFLSTTAVKGAFGSKREALWFQDTG